MALFSGCKLMLNRRQCKTWACLITEHFLSLLWFIWHELSLELSFKKTFFENTHASNAGTGTPASQEPSRSCSKWTLYSLSRNQLVKQRTGRTGLNWILMWFQIKSQLYLNIHIWFMLKHFMKLEITLFPTSMSNYTNAQQKIHSENRWQILLILCF